MTTSGPYFIKQDRGFGLNAENLQIALQPAVLQQHA